MNFVILMRDTKFHNFIILTIIMPASHDSVAEKRPYFRNAILRPESENETKSDCFGSACQPRHYSQNRRAGRCPSFSWTLSGIGATAVGNWAGWVRGKAVAAL